MQPHIQMSEHSPSLGPVQMLVRNPDPRESLKVETDNRRWSEKQIGFRITKTLEEVKEAVRRLDVLGEALREEATERVGQDKLLLVAIEQAKSAISALEERLRTAWAFSDRLETELGFLRAETIRLSTRLSDARDAESALALRVERLASQAENNEANRLLERSSLMEQLESQRQLFREYEESAEAQAATVTAQIAELQREVRSLSGRTWWSMLKDSVRRLVHGNRQD